ncbi:MAG: hypothetical protein ACRDYA_23075 [Egibacteraceae bacterium]
MRTVRDVRASVRAWFAYPSYGDMRTLPDSSSHPVERIDLDGQIVGLP